MIYDVAVPKTFEELDVEAEVKMRARFGTWHRKFAWRPTPITTTQGKIRKVWLGYYERRLIQVEVRHQSDPIMGFFKEKTLVWERRLFAHHVATKWTEAYCFS
jgi:hypothetical protein